MEETIQKNITKEEQQLLQSLNFDLEYFDQSVTDLFKNKLQVNEGGEVKEVKVRFATPERWVTMLNEGAYLDKNKNPILPLIVIRRRDLDLPPENEVFMYGNKGKITLYKQLLQDKSVSEKDPIFEIFKAYPPRFIQLTYDARIMTRYYSSINKIIESIIMKNKKFYIKNLTGVFDAFSDESNTDDFSENIRIISNTATITVSGFLWNEKFAEVEKYYTVNKITLTERTIP